MEHCQKTQYEMIYTNAPTEEPARQYYFIDQVRKLFEENFTADLQPAREEEHYSEAHGESRAAQMRRDGVYGSYKVVTFGCQMNSRDSEKLAAILEECGLSEADHEEEADVALFNTCTVR